MSWCATIFWPRVWRVIEMARLYKDAGLLIECACLGLAVIFLFLSMVYGWPGMGVVSVGLVWLCMMGVLMIAHTEEARRE